MHRGIVVFLISIALYGIDTTVIRTSVPMPDGRIVGGENVDISELPHQVSVRFAGGHICGGSIIRKNVVVTAAHCILYNYPKAFSVEYGSSKVGDGKNVVAVDRIVVHPNYNSNTIDFDVAILHLQSSINLGNNAKAIELADKRPADGTPAIVSGWGTLKEGGSSPTQLQKVNVSIVSQKQCQTQYNDVNEITSRMVCAGVPEGGKDACQGDSGGPLIANNKLVGIVSWGVGCARKDFAGVYSNVAELHKWIVGNL